MPGISRRFPQHPLLSHPQSILSLLLVNLGESHQELLLNHRRYCSRGCALFLGRAKLLLY